MSKHIWLTRRYQRDTLATGMIIYKVARSVGRLGILEACCFVGYALESVRQKGREMAWVYLLGAVPDPDAPRGFITGPDCSRAIMNLWNRVASSGHRYSRGKNKGNYELAGRRVLAQQLRLAWSGGGEALLGALIKAFEDEGEWQPLHDYLEERAGMGAYDLVRETLISGPPLPLAK